MPLCNVLLTFGYEQSGALLLSLCKQAACSAPLSTLSASAPMRLLGVCAAPQHAASALPCMCCTAPAAEVAKSEWAAVQQGPPWAVDAWGMGCLIQVGMLSSSLEAPQLVGLPHVCLGHGLLSCLVQVPWWAAHMPCQ